MVLTPEILEGNVGKFVPKFQFGRIKDYTDGYLAEFYWKSRYHFNTRMHHFLLEVARQYDLKAEI